MDTGVSASGVIEPDILHLPEELVEHIGSRLEKQDQCSLEIASRSFYKTLSSPSQPIPYANNPGPSFNVKPISPVPSGRPL